MYRNIRIYKYIKKYVSFYLYNLSFYLYCVYHRSYVTFYLYCAKREKKYIIYSTEKNGTECQFTSIFWRYMMLHITPQKEQNTYLTKQHAQTGKLILAQLTGLLCPMAFLKTLGNCQGESWPFPVDRANTRRPFNTSKNGDAAELRNQVSNSSVLLWHT